AARQAARYAVGGATYGQTLKDKAAWGELTASGCSKAGRLCLKRSGAISQLQFTPLDTMTTDHFDVFIRLTDPGVASADQMRLVPQGSILGFIEENPPNRVLMHAMVATGHGLAAGNKNSCLGFGNDFGWEILDLANNLHWVAGDGRVNVAPSPHQR